MCAIKYGYNYIRIIHCNCIRFENFSLGSSGWGIFRYNIS